MTRGFWATPLITTMPPQQAGPVGQKYWSQATYPAGTPGPASVGCVPAGDEPAEAGCEPAVVTGPDETFGAVSRSIPSQDPAPTTTATAKATDASLSRRRRTSLRPGGR